MHRTKNASCVLKNASRHLLWWDLSSALLSTICLLLLWIPTVLSACAAFQFSGPHRPSCAIRLPTIRRQAFLIPALFQQSSKRSSSTTVLSANPDKRLVFWTKEDDDLLKELDQKATELKLRTNKAMQEFDTLVTDALATRSGQIIEQVAVEVVKLLAGDWKLSILTARDDVSTSAIMDGNIAEMTQLSDALGLKMTSDDIQKERLSVQSDFDATSYPPRLQTRILLSDTQVIQFYGQLQFDVIEKQVAFIMDELNVLGVEIDLNSTMMKEAAAEGLQETPVVDEEESGESGSSDNGMVEKASHLQRIKNFFKRVFLGKEKEKNPEQQKVDAEKPAADDAATVDGNRAVEEDMG